MLSLGVLASGTGGSSQKEVGVGERREGVFARIRSSVAVADLIRDSVLESSWAVKNSW